jgi:signal transduction histidine kinase
VASGRLRFTSTVGSAPPVQAPRTLAAAARSSASLLGHDLLHRFRAERFEFFLSGHLALWASSAVVLPLWEYIALVSSPRLLAITAVGTAQCVVLVVGLRLARRARYQQSIELVCIGTWASVTAITFISPPLLPALILVAMVPVAFAEPYVSLRRGLVFTVITAVVVLAMTVLGRFNHLPVELADATHWVETAFLIMAVPLNVLHLMVIVWNNAAALRTSESRLAEHAAELAASRTRLTAAADEERRRLERDLHDGAQQHLVALSVLVQLARTADKDRAEPLLTEAADLVDTAIGEIRRLAHGIYPPLLISGGLAEALPALAARAAVPVLVDLGALGRYPPSTEAAFYYCCSEALQNAAKHGGADVAVTVTAVGDAESLTLTISDTGRGFAPTTTGTGLTNMTDRLSAIGGSLEVDSAPGRGTRVVAAVEGVYTPPPTV